MGLLLRRWFRLQDNAAEAFTEGRLSSDADHFRAIEEMQTRHEQQLVDLERRYRRDVAALRTAVTQLQQGIAEIIPLVQEEHRLTAVEIMLRMSQPISVLRDDTPGSDTEE